MGTLFRVRVGWTGTLPGVPYLSTLFFGSGSYVEQDAVDSTRAFLNSAKGLWSTALTATVEPEVSLIDDVTGALVGVTSVTPPGSVAGENSNEPLPVASQGLARLSTSTVAGGRILKGHMFIPAPTADLNDNGAPTSGYVSVLASKVADFIDDTTSELRVWSRTHGVSGLVTSGSAAPYWAVLRSRRD